MTKEEYTTKSPETVEEFQEYIGLARQNGEISWLMEEFLARNPHLDSAKSKAPTHEGSVQYFEDVLSEKAEIEDSLEARVKGVMRKNFVKRAYQNPVVKAVGSVAAAGVMIGAAVLGAMKGKDYSAKGPAEPVIDFPDIHNETFYQGRSVEPISINNNDGAQFNPEIHNNEVVYENNDNDHVELYNLQTHEREDLGMGWQPEVTDNYVVMSYGSQLKIVNKISGLEELVGITTVSFDAEGDKVVFAEQGGGIINYGLYDIPSKQITWLEEGISSTPKTVKPVIEGNHVAWLNFERDVYVVQNLNTDERIEVPQSFWDSYFSITQFGLSDGKLFARGDGVGEVLVTDIATNTTTSETLASTPSGIVAEGNNLVYMSSNFDPSKSGLFLKNRISGQVTQLQSAQGATLTTFNIDNGKIVWAWGETPEEMDIRVYDPTGFTESPFYTPRVSDIDLSELSHLDYDSNSLRGILKFIVDGATGGADLKFELVDSDMNVAVDTDKEIREFSLIVENGETGELEEIVMHSDGISSGKQTFSANVQVETDSTAKVYLEDVLTNLASGSDPVSAVTQALVTGSLEIVTDKWGDSAIKGLKVNGVETPINYHLQDVMDYASWDQKIEEVVIFSPVDLDVYQGSTRINDAGNAVYSGPNSHPEFWVQFDPSNSKKTFKLTGTGDGTYTMVHRIVENGRIISEDTYEDISIERGEIHEYGLDESGDSESLVDDDESGDLESLVDEDKSSSGGWLLATVPTLAVIGGAAYVAQTLIRGRYRINKEDWDDDWDDDDDDTSPHLESRITLDLEDSEYFTEEGDDWDDDDWEDDWDDDELNYISKLKDNNYETLPAELDEVLETVEYNKPKFTREEPEQVYESHKPPKKKSEPIKDSSTKPKTREYDFVKETEWMLFELDELEEELSDLEDLISLLGRKQMESTEAYFTQRREKIENFTAQINDMVQRNDEINELGAKGRKIAKACVSEGKEKIAELTEDILQNKNEFLTWYKKQREE